LIHIKTLHTIRDQNRSFATNIAWVGY